MVDEATVRAAQARARDYFRTRCTEAPADRIRASVRDACESIETFLTTIPEAAATASAHAGEWSIQETVDHLVETYRPGLDELRCLLGGQAPPGDPIPASLRSKASRLRPWPWLLRELTQIHADVAAVLAAAPDDWPTTVRAPIVMVVNVEDTGGTLVPIEWVEDLDWKAYAMVSWRLHTIDHMKQARAALSALRT
jgi:hypothetical protein